MKLRLAVKQILRQRVWSIFFVLNLSLSLAALLLVDGFRGSILAQMNQNSRNILGADLAVSARRMFTEQEKQIIDENVKANATTTVFDFFAMLKFKDNSRLVLVRAIDRAYPLHGKLISDRQQSLKDSFSQLESGGTFIYPEVQQQLGLNIGDEFELGKLKLKVTSVVDKDDTQTFRGASIAPKIFIDRSLLPKSELIQFGSTFTQSILFRFSLDEQKADQAGANEKAEAAKKLIYKNITDPGVQVETSASAGEDAGRQFSYLSDYLGLIAMVSFLLSLLGSFYLLRSNLLQSIKNFAILRSIGMLPREVEQIELLRVLILGALASLFAIPISLGLAPILVQVLRSLMTTDLSVSLDPKNVVFLFYLSPGVLVLFLLPQVRAFKKVTPNQLFQDSAIEARTIQVQYLGLLPALAAIYFLCFWLTKSWSTTSVFLSALIGSALVLTAVGWLSQWLVAKVNFQSWSLRYGILSLRRNPRSLLILVCTIGLGSLMATLPNQIKNNLVNEFSLDRGSSVPSLFMFDIQDEQIKPVLELIESQKAKAIIVSPLIRARIKSINGQSYERVVDPAGFQTREAERDARFRNRGVNLSYREKLSASENIVEGKDFSGPYKNISDSESPSKDVIAKGRPIEVSIEQKYAERVGIKLGDQMEFDVQGVELKAKVINLRHVKWTSFSPNFFILVQPGSLDLAPKTWITGVSGIDGADQGRIQALQSSIVKLAPNVSVINLKKTIGEVLALSEKMIGALQLMAALCLLTGFVILYSLIKIQIQGRLKEFNMLRVLGADRDKLFRYVSVPFFLVVGSAIFVGVALSILISFVLLNVIFDLKAQLDFLGPLSMILLIAALCFLVIAYSVVSIFQTESSLQRLFS